jgi:hypothetical protein
LTSNKNGNQLGHYYCLFVLFAYLLPPNKCSVEIGNQAELGLIDELPPTGEVDALLLNLFWIT